ncbi:MAG: mycothiol biosynthesis protein [Homoserinimonas sp.]|jgi:N-acetyl-1-D-myo-inositol-2-amino-2-deoxy-alpha-D-glucopyranoside deacetylase|nr:mycothiol biosynthesis protein [Homoserinimonas sp.]
MDATGRRYLFVHAHPDDETISTGGTIAQLVDQGAEVTVLTCTRGERGEVIPPELAHLEFDAVALGEHRMGELSEAMRILGVSDHRYLGDTNARLSSLQPRRYLDSGMVWGETGALPIPASAEDELSSQSLCAAPLHEVAADIASVIAQVQPTAVVSYAADGGYGHPDHIRAHQATARACEVMSVPFFTIEPDSTAPAEVVDVTAQLERKAGAMRAHRTQITVSGDSYALSSGPTMPIASREAFREASTVGEEPTSFARMGTGSRVASAALSLVGGSVIGVLATINHQFAVSPFGVVIPLGLIAALLISTALMVGLRLLFDHRVPATLAAVGLLVTLFVFAQTGPGGSVLIPATAVGYVWAFGLPLAAAVVLAWPRMHSTRGNSAQVEAARLLSGSAS